MFCPFPCWPNLKFDPSRGFRITHSLVAAEVSAAATPMHARNREEASRLHLCKAIWLTKYREILFLGPFFSSIFVPLFVCFFFSYFLDFGVFLFCRWPRPLQAESSIFTPFCITMLLLFVSRCFPKGPSRTVFSTESDSVVFYYYLW